MRIATFNINGINTRLASLLEWLEAARPDVACLQELKATDAQFPAAAVRLTDAGVDRTVRGRERASDHAPVWIELD